MIVFRKDTRNQDDQDKRTKPGLLIHALWALRYAGFLLRTAMAFRTRKGCGQADLTVICLGEQMLMQN